MVAANNNIVSKEHQNPQVDQNQSLPSDNIKPVFQEFSWYENRQKSREECLIQDARDVSDGLSVILGMIEHGEIAKDVGDAQIISSSERGYLIRMAIASSRLLSSACDRNIQASNEIYRRRAQAGAQQ